MAFGRKKRLLDAGAPAPDFRLPLLAGGETSLREILAKGPAVLAFFKITCPVCQFTFPFLERLHAGGTLPFYGVSQNGASDTRAFNREYGVTFPMLLDSEAAGYTVSNAFGISSVPTAFLIEPDGSISQVIEGWSKRDIASLGQRAGVEPFRPGDYVPEWKAG